MVNTLVWGLMQELEKELNRHWEKDIVVLVVKNDAQWMLKECRGNRSMHHSLGEVDVRVCLFQ